MAKEKDKDLKHCNCDDSCTCGCNEGDACSCGEGCSIDGCGCGDDCSCHDKEKEYLELAQRIKAEFDNYKRRNLDVTKQSFDNGVVTTVSKLLPAIDAFKQARNNIKDEETLKGIEMIEGLIIKAFGELGVEKIDCVDKEFDPNFHNAVMVGKDENKPDNVVLDEYQEGFKLKDRVIRHSVVRINKLG